MTTTGTRLRSRAEECAAAPPEAFAAFRAVEETRLERLKQELLERLLDEASARPDLNVAFRRAADEAARLAWLTPFPFLCLPALVAEKADEARECANRQRDLLTRTAKAKVSYEPVN
jgi:hypothetical protein